MWYTCGSQFYNTNWSDMGHPNRKNDLLDDPLSLSLPAAPPRSPPKSHGRRTAVGSSHTGPTAPGKNTVEPRNQRKADGRTERGQEGVLRDPGEPPPVLFGSLQNVHSHLCENAVSATRPPLEMNEHSGTNGTTENLHGPKQVYTHDMENNSPKPMKFKMVPSFNSSKIGPTNPCRPHRSNITSQAPDSQTPSAGHPALPRNASGRPQCSSAHRSRAPWPAMRHAGDQGTLEVITVDPTVVQDSVNHGVSNLRMLQYVSQGRS